MKKIYNKKKLNHRKRDIKNSEKYSNNSTSAEGNTLFMKTNYILEI